MPKELLISGTTPAGASLNETERSVFTRALRENAGRLPLAKLMDWSALGQGRARAMQEEWAQRGPDRQDSRSG